MPPKPFTTSQVAEITGLSVRQLNHWAQRLIFIPSILQSNGPGTRKLYSSDDVIQLLSLKKLKCYRWSTQKIQRAISMLREVMNDSNPLSQAMLFADKNTMIAVCKTRSGEHMLLDALKPGGQQVLGIVIETLEEEIQLSMRQLVGRPETLTLGSPFATSEEIR